MAAVYTPVTIFMPIFWAEAYNLELGLLVQLFCALFIVGVAHV